MPFLTLSRGRGRAPFVLAALSALTLLVLAGYGPPAGAQSVAATAPYQAWTQVPEYNVRYEVTYTDSFTLPWEWHGSVHDYVMNMSAVATGKIQFESTNGRYAQWSGHLQIQGNYEKDEHWYTPLKTLGVVQERASGPDALGFGMFFHLLIDTETGTYEIVTTDLIMDGTVVDDYGEGPNTWAAKMQVPCPAPMGRELPSERPPLAYVDKLTVQAPPFWRLADDHTADMNVRIDIFPDGPKPEFILKPVSPKWIPQPGSTIAAQVVPKKAGQTPAPIRFILEDVTREPGIHLNSADLGTEPDLEFAPSTGFNPAVADGADGFRMESNGPVMGGTATIKARDYGAWGKLRAEAQIDGAWQPIPVERSNLGYLTLPVDLDGNKVADEWEKKAKVKGRAGTWDAEPLPTLNGTPGDGLSLYEEYRGLSVEGAHQRLSPGDKELIVQNLAGPQVKPGIAVFAAASRLRVLTLAPDELGGDRVVNANSVFARTRDQHGLRLTNVSLPEGELGQAVPAELTDKRPATCQEVQVDIAQILASPPPIAAQEELINTVAHELAHGIGAAHHGEGAAPLIERFLTSGHQAPAHLVYGSDRKVISERPFEIQGRIGGLGSLASGDTACIMAYNSYYQWAVQRTPGGEFRYYAQEYRKPGVRFCSSRNGTGVNGPKNKPAPFFGHAERGNCLGQLCPRDP